MITEAEASDRIPVFVWLGVAIALVLAIGPWPYGFYALLRIIVCAASAFAAWKLGKASLARWAFIILVFLYNPVFRVSFDREIWSVINVISAIPFLWVGFLQRRTRPAA